MSSDQSLRIAIADDEPDMRHYFQKILPRLGHQVVASAQDGQDLIKQCHLTRPDLVITNIKMPAMDGIEATRQIYANYPIPVILVSACQDSDFIARAEADHVMGYLVKPIKQADLPPVIALAMKRFEQFQTLHKDAADLRQALEGRKPGPMDEPEAFGRLQNLDKKKRELIDFAQMITMAEEAVQALGANKAAGSGRNRVEVGPRLFNPGSENSRRQS
jgi:two-component system, response regulator PdtaR